MILSSSFYKTVRKVVLKAYTFLVKSKFKKLDSNLSPWVDVTNPEFISIGCQTSIRDYSWIYAIKGDHTGNVFSPEIIIGKGCSIGRFCHITASGSVILEDEVFLTEGVLITDSIHGYKDIEVSVVNQPLISKSPLRIGKGTWIGNGARIVGKVDIGKNCIISANTLISNVSIPDHSVVMGIPGRIVKKYEPEINKWVEVK